MRIDKVKRNYYVYLHKDKETDIPFYVGKGAGNRAYSKYKRSNAWKKKVDSFSAGYKVEIVEDGITEAEAYDLERKLIGKYGCEWDNSGTLVNQSSGGNVITGDNFGITIDIELPSQIAEIIEQEDDFKDLDETEQKDFIRSILPKIIELSEPYKTINEIDEYPSFLDNCVFNFLYYMPKVINKYNSSKISFGYLADYFEGCIWDIQGELEEAGSEPQREGIIDLAKSICGFFNERLDYLYNEK